jgi:hypothetical protein
MTLNTSESQVGLVVGPTVGQLYVVVYVVTPREPQSATVHTPTLLLDLNDLAQRGPPAAPQPRVHSAGVQHRWGRDEPCSGQPWLKRCGLHGPSKLVRSGCLESAGSSSDSSSSAMSMSSSCMSRSTLRSRRCNVVSRAGTRSMAPTVPAITPTHDTLSTPACCSPGCVVPFYYRGTVVAFRPRFQSFFQHTRPLWDF